MSKIKQTYNNKHYRIYPSFGYCESKDLKSPLPLTYCFNAFRNYLKALPDYQQISRDTLKQIRYTVRQFCEGHSQIYPHPKYYFSKIVSKLMFLEGDEGDVERAKLVDLLTKEYQSLYDKRFIYHSFRSPLYSFIKYITLYYDNPVVMVNILGILYFYEI